jgi:hypothetical protein
MHNICDACETVKHCSQQGCVPKQTLKPCRSPYCECTPGTCSHPGCYDARGEPWTSTPTVKDNSNYRLDPPGRDPLHAAKRVAPVQEPMMYEDWYDPSSCGHCGMVNGHAPECRHNYKPLAQRQWVGLTDDEIYDSYSEPRTDSEMVAFAREVEAKLREKNT